MPFVLPVALELPAVYTKFINGFSFLNLSPLLRFFRFECMTRIDHYDQVLAMTLGPIIVATLTFVAVRTSGGGRQAREALFNFFLLGTFFIYPSTSTVLFQTFRCEAFRAPTSEGDDYVESYLRADLRLACASGSSSALESGGMTWDPDYVAMWSYSLCFVFVYPLGERAAARCVFEKTAAERMVR